MILALILAASLESESIGDFFTLPDWMPRSVASENTPGSDPDGGDGWYIDEYTNGVVLASTWDMYIDSVKAPDKQTPDYMDGLGWFVFDPEMYAFQRDVSEVYEIIDVRPNVYRSPAEDKAEELEFSADIEYLPTQGSEDSVTWHRTLKLVRDKTIGPIATGRKVPRSPRLTTEVMAGVNSTFEAFFERMYFAGQGQTNSWNEAQWGSRNDFRTFWFKPSLHGGSEYIGWDYGTNRTIVSRRLNEWERIDSLAYYLQTGLEGGYRFGVSNRPGWIKEFWWGTTASDLLTDSYLVPPFSWMQNPTRRSMWVPWETASRVLGTLYDTDSWRGRVGYSADYPTAKMMQKLYFGQNASARHDVADDWYYPHDCIPSAEGTVDSLIETNFPHADGGAITNDTRRLFSDRLCCVNQFLGTIDRTYHLPEISWADYGSNIYKTVTRISTGTMPCLLTWNGDGYDVQAEGDLSWVDSTNTVKVTSERIGGGDGQALYYRVSASSTYVDYSLVSTNKNSFGAMDDDYVRLAVAEAKAHGFEPKGTFAVSFSPVSSGGTPRIYCSVRNADLTGWSFNFPIDYPGEIHSSLSVPFEYRRGFYYLRTQGRKPVLGAIQPGWQSRGRAGDSRYGAVEALHTCSDRASQAGLTTMSWDINKSACEYKSVSDSQYTSVVNLTSGVEAIATEAYQRFVQWVGFDPESTNPLQLIPIDNGDFHSVRDSVIVTPNPTASVIDRLYTTYAYCSFDGGGALNIEYRETVDTSAQTYTPGYLDLFGIAFSGTVTATRSPQVTEMKSKYADIRVGVITRTDWQWQTLKRSN